MTTIGEHICWSSLKVRSVTLALLVIIIVSALVVYSLKSNHGSVQSTLPETTPPEKTENPSSPDAISVKKQDPVMVKHKTKQEKAAQQQHKDEIKQLLARADQAFLAGKYVEPPRDNAFAYYLDVLILDPENTNALEGKQRIFDHYELDNALTVYNKGNYSHAFKLLAQIADKGNARATFKLALLYYSGLGVPKDEKKAMQLIADVKDEIQMKANNGKPWAETDLSRMYKHGWHVTRDIEKSLTLLESAASKNFAPAQIYLGMTFIEKEKYAEALQLFKKAAQQDVAAAQYYLGLMHQHGFGVPTDASKASDWYRMAAEQGLAHAQSHVGWMYENGVGVSQDYDEAVKWYLKAAEQNDASAQNNLGVLYELGRGVTRNNTEAMKWYHMAAEQNHAMARQNLGRMYLNGYRLPTDKTEAVK